MIQIFVDPAADDPLDVIEIEHHAVRVEPRGIERQNRPTVVPVQMAALALVIQQPMAVTEVDFA